MIQRVKRDVDEIRRLYVDERLSMKAVAKIVGCGANTIKRDLISIGVLIRERWEQRKIDEAAGRAVTQSERIQQRHVDGCYANAMTPERCKRMSELASQRTGEKNPFFGKKHSEETKRRLSELAKANGLGHSNHRRRGGGRGGGNTGGWPGWNNLSDEAKERIRHANREHGRLLIGEKNPFYGKKHTLETRLKISAARGGDGKSFIPKRGYPVEWTVELRASIRDREGYRCLMCGKPQGKRKLSVHHVDYDRWNNSEKNLVALCIACHCKTNVRRKAWIAFFGAFGLGRGGDVSH